MSYMQILKIHDGTNKRPCELCGLEVELRPYGPHGEWICFECGLKNEPTTTAKFLETIGMSPERATELAALFYKKQGE